MEKRTKHWRIEQRNRIYKVKMRLFASYGGIFILNDERIANPRWVDLYQPIGIRSISQLELRVVVGCVGEKFITVVHTKKKQ